MFSFVHEIFAHCTARIRSYELKRAGFGSGSCDYDGVIHGTVLLKVFYKVGNCGTLLTYGYIDTDNILALLVDDRIGGDGSFTCLTVTDDKLTLSASDGDHGVDSFDTCLKRLKY